MKPDFPFESQWRASVAVREDGSIDHQYYERLAHQHRSEAAWTLLGRLARPLRAGRRREGPHDHARPPAR